MRRPLPPSADASAMEKVCSAEGASNSGDAVAGERRAAATEHNSRGSALGVWGANSDVVGDKRPRIADGSHDELSARSMR